MEFMLIYLLFSSIILTLAVIFIPIFFYKKFKETHQIESGFETISKTSNKSFSVNFFYILIIFIVFDLELIFIFSVFLKMNFFNFLFLIIFIYFTLLLEWQFNKIKWIN